MKVELSEVNKILEDFTTIRSSYRGNGLTKVATEIVKTIDDNYEGSEGETGLSYEIYQSGDLYIKVKIETDSYGDNENITGIQFVEPREKLI